MPRIASEVTLFPHPDSPTMPSVSPGAMSKDTPLTACTVPRPVPKWTRRFSTERSGSLGRLGGLRRHVPLLDDLRLRRLDVADATAQLRVERLPEPVADQVESEHRDHDRNPRDD